VTAGYESGDNPLGLFSNDVYDVGKNINYFFGITGKVGSSWLMNKKTQYSIRSSPYSTAYPNQGKSFGIIGGIDLTEKLSFQFDGLVHNENGQSYKEYSEGKLVNSRIYLNYTSLNILGRYRIVKSNLNLPVSQHFVMGFYGSYLKNAFQMLDEGKEDLDQLYKNYDFGLISGYDFDTKISRDFTLSTGLRYDPGLINIYKGGPSLPADFNKTYSSSVSICLSLKYNISGQRF
jgi:hypothetical protein